MGAMGTILEDLADQWNTQHVLDLLSQISLLQTGDHTMHIELHRHSEQLSKAIAARDHCCDLGSDGLLEAAIHIQPCSI